MITRADVADLRPGDVVELWRNTWPDGTVVRGPLRQFQRDWLYVAEMAVFSPTEGRALGASYSLTVVSRAPRPLYVNSDRTEPVPGDVVRDAETDATKHTWVRNVDGFSNEWLAVPGHVYVPRSQLPARLRLLVDGATGQAVTS